MSNITFIYVSDIVSLAMLEKNEDSIKLEEVGNLVYHIQKNLTNQRKIVLYSEDYIQNFLDEYKDLVSSGGNLIYINKGHKIDDMRALIASYIPLDKLLMLMPVIADFYFNNKEKVLDN